MKIINSLKFIAGHPLNRGRPLHAFARYAAWQVCSRLQSEVEFDWIEGTRLVVRNGMTGATGNIYCGLHEYEDMAFVLHVLQPGDLFVDVGANIGSYTVLASGVCGARTIAIEPDPDTASHLRRNIEVNDLGRMVRLEQTAVGAEKGKVCFTKGRDTVNKVACEGDEEVQTVALSRLDDLLEGVEPVVIKMDVEGFETEVLRGALSTIAKSSLLAIEAETVDRDAKEILEAAGFERYAYDPRKRSLTKAASHTASNSLFIRDAPVVRERLRQAPPRRFRYHEI